MKTLIAAAALALTATAASAGYNDLDVVGPDVFGETNVTATMMGDNSFGVVIKCGTDAAPIVAFLFRNASAADYSFSTMIWDIEGARGSSEDAMVVPWNDTYAAVSFEPTDDQLSQIAAGLAAATGSFSFGAKFWDMKKADTFTSRGSTAVGNAIATHCVGASL